MLKHIVLAAFLTCGAIGAYAQNTNQASAPPRNATTPAPAPATVSTGDFNVSGEMAGSAIIGAKVHDDAGSTIGKIDELYLDDNGAIKVVVVTVGGLMGVGGRDVAVKWSDIKFQRDGKSVLLTTSLGKDALQALPDYKDQRRQPESAAATPAKPASPMNAPATNR
jgi:sporulation protein YlmC with PRC-barrel domain